MSEPHFQIRRATADDADGVAMVLRSVVSERIHSAIDCAWTPDQQRSYLESLSNREVFHAAVAASGTLIGFQSLDLYSPVLPSMSHVGQLGTFLLPEWRGQGVGKALFNATRTSLGRRAIENWSSRSGHRMRPPKAFTSGSGSLSVVDFVAR